SKSADSTDAHEGCDDEIAVTVTLTDLNEVEREQYAEFLTDDGALTVTKHSSSERTSHYSVRGRTYPPFASLRDLFQEKAMVFQQAYKDFVSEHPDLELTVPRSS